MVDSVSLVQEPLLIEVWQGNDYTVVTTETTEINTSGITFITLQDTPENYTGYAGYSPVVNEDENGLEFKQVLPRAFTGLTDCPTSYKNSANKFVRVKSDLTGLEFVKVTDGEVKYFADLADVDSPEKEVNEDGNVISNYPHLANYVVKVNENENGIGFDKANNLLEDKFKNTKDYTYPKLTVDEKGLITAIESLEPGTILPNYNDYSLLCGDNSNVPIELDNGAEGTVLMSNGTTTLPSFQFLNYLTIGNTENKAIEFLNNAEVQDYKIEVSYNKAGPIIDIKNNDSTISADLEINCQNYGAIRLGKASNKIELNCDTTVGTRLVSSGTLLNLAPKATGTIRVDTNELKDYSYTNNIQDKNDLINKEYLDRTIEDLKFTVENYIHCLDVRTLYSRNISEVYSLALTNRYADEIKIKIEESFSDGAYLTVSDKSAQGEEISGKIYLKDKNAGDLIVLPLFTQISGSKIYVTLHLDEATSSNGKLNFMMKYF